MADVKNNSAEQSLPQTLLASATDTRPPTAADSLTPRQLPASDVDSAGASSSINSGKQNVSILPRSLKEYTRLHAQQWNRIAQRSDEDGQLTELMRDYFKRRLELEQQMATNLEKLNKQYRMKSIQLATQYQATGSGQNQLQMVEDALSAKPTTESIPETGSLDTSKSNQPSIRRPSNVLGAREHRPSSILIASKNSPSFLLPPDANMSSHSLQISDQSSNDNVCITRLSHIAFHKMLMDSDLAAAARTQLTEQLSQVVVDRLKEVSKEKQAFSRKMYDWVSKVQAQVWNEYVDLEKSKRAYDEAYETMQYYKAKYETQQHAPKSGLRDLMTSKEERIDKARKKFVDALQTLGNMRNKYIIQTSIVNAVQRQLYENVVPEWMRNIDGDFYLKFQQSLFEYVQLERSSASKATAALEETKQAAANIHQKDEHLLFFNENRHVFNIRQEIKLVPAHDQDRMVMTMDEHSKKELQTGLDWLVGEYKLNIKDLHRKEQELKALYTLKSSYQRNPDFGKAESTIDARTSACHDFSRLLIAKAKLEGQITLLVENGLSAPSDLIVPDPVISLPSTEQLALSSSRMSGLNVQRVSDNNPLSLPEIKQTESLSNLSFSPKKSTGAPLPVQTSALKQHDGAYLTASVTNATTSATNKNASDLNSSSGSKSTWNESKKSVGTAGTHTDAPSPLGDLNLGPGSRFSLNLSNLNLNPIPDADEKKEQPFTVKVVSVTSAKSVSKSDNAKQSSTEQQMAPSAAHKKMNDDSQSIGSYDSPVPEHKHAHKTTAEPAVTIITSSPSVTFPASTNKTKTEDMMHDSVNTTETKAIALFQYSATTGSEMDLREDALIDVLQDPSECADGWIECRDPDSGNKGLVPLTYLCVNSKSEPQFGRRYEVTAAYQAQSEHELTLNLGDIIILRSKETGTADRWEGIVEGRVGLFPAHLVRAMDSQPGKI